MAATLIHVVGLGGTGGWFLPWLFKSVPHTTELHLWDDDVVERKNLARQNFYVRDLTTPKPAALCRHFVLEVPAPKFVVHQAKADARLTGDLIFCFADNHGARKDVISSVYEGKAAAAIVAGNEFQSAEAYIVFPEDKDTAHDPFKKYPELLTGNLARKSCASAPPEEQSLTANVVAASAAMILWDYWFGRLHFADPELQKKFAPHHVDWGGTKFRVWNESNIATSTAKE